MENSTPKSERSIEMGLVPSGLPLPAPEIRIPALATSWLTMKVPGGT